MEHTVEEDKSEAGCVLLFFIVKWLEFAWMHAYWVYRIGSKRYDYGQSVEFI